MKRKMKADRYERMVTTEEDRINSVMADAMLIAKEKDPEAKKYLVRTMGVETAKKALLLVLEQLALGAEEGEFKINKMKVIEFKEKYEKFKAAGWLTAAEQKQINKFLKKIDAYTI